MASSTHRTYVKDMIWWNSFLQKNYYGSDSKEWEKTVRALCREAELEPGMKVLELGSGSGRIVNGLAKRGIETWGIELSEALVKECSKTARIAELPLAHFIKADMFSYEPEQLFDAIFSVNTSFGFGDDEQNRSLIGKIGSWLAPDGVFYLDVCTADAAESYGTWSDRVGEGTLIVESSYNPDTHVFTNSPNWISSDGSKIYKCSTPEHVQLYRRDDLESMIRSAGMKPERLKKAMGRWFEQTDKQMQTTYVCRKAY